MYKVYFEGTKPIKVENQSDVINYLICHNAIGYEKLNDKSAYEILEEKYKRALKEKNKYKKIVRELEKSIKSSYYKYTGEQINALQDVLNKLKELKGDKND